MTVSPIAGVAPLNVGVAAPPQQPASLHAVLAGGANLGGAVVESSNYGMPAVPGVGSAVAAAAGPAAAAQAPVTGGGDQAMLGASAVNQEQLVGALQNVIAAVTALVAALQAQGGGVSGGGAPGPGAPAGSVGQCGMAGCAMDHGASNAAAGAAAAGASGAPEAAPKRDAAERAKETRKKKKPSADAGAGAAPAPSGSGRGQTPQAYASQVRKVSGETSHSGLNEKAFKLLGAAHDHGLKLISGHRPGDEGSGHSNGSAVDVANVPGGSRQGSPEMREYAEAIRAAGKAGDPNVGYVIYQQQIASAKNGWAWRDMEDRGDNTQNHFDHVHVSSDPSL